MTDAISRIATAKRRSDSHNRNVIEKRRTKLSPQSSEFTSSSSQNQSFDEVRIPPDADLTIWVCIGMHVISVDGEVSEALPLVPINKQIDELHRPHHPPHIGMALFQGQKKNPRVQFERALEKYTGANWCCKISASRRRDAMSSAESNGERSFVVSKKWSHLTFHVKERQRFASDASLDSSASMSSQYVSLSTISVDLKLLPERAPRLPLPSHFYGEIGKTEEGAKRLKESGHVEKLASRVYDEEFSTLYVEFSIVSHQLLLDV